MEQKKEHYKNIIINTIMSIENVDMLVYLNRLISNIVKAGR